MRNTFALLTLLVVACSSCNNAVKENTKADIETTVNETTRASSSREYASVIFGKYCGHCLGNCTSMFQYKMEGNANTLLADTTDSFLRKGKFQFNWFIVQEQHSLAKALVDNMPQLLKATNDTLTRFGCPDCADQCGLYLETVERNSSTVKKFYFDTDTAQVPRELRSFAGLLHNTVNQLKQ